MKRSRSHLFAVVLSLGATAVASGKTLPFWDFAHLDDWHNVELVQTRPTPVSEATYTDPAFPDSSMIFPSVWRDEESGRWRMIYSLKWSPFTIMAAESRDGIRWHPLAVPDAEPEGGKLAPHHVLTFPSGQGSGIYRDPLAVDGWPFKIFGRQDADAVFPKALADPTHRWHAPAKEAGKKRYMSEAVTLGSKDGLHWQILEKGDWAREDWAPEPPVFAFFRQEDQAHVLTARPGWGDRRVVTRETTDFQTWRDPVLLFQPDALDTAGTLGFYGMPVLRSGPGYVGVLWTFRNSSSDPVNSYNQFFGDFDSQLTFSYDGDRFHRGKRQAFIPLNPIPEHGCSQIRPCSLVANETAIHIYSESHQGPHGRERAFKKLKPETPSSAVVLHTLRPDGFMHLRSQGDRARIQTKPLVLRSATLTMNAVADFGELRFQLTDVKSQPMAGFTFDDCEPLRHASALKHPLKWKDADLESVLMQPLRLEIQFRQANLFALHGDWHWIDAQDLWLLDDGQPIPMELFDGD